MVFAAFAKYISDHWFQLRENNRNVLFDINIDIHTYMNISVDICVNINVDIFKNEY